MKRTAVVLSALLAPLALALPAGAEPPARETDTFEGTHTAVGVCSFPLEVQDSGAVITTTYSDAQGEVVRIRGVYPGSTATVTNVETGESITAAISGPEFLTFHPDGSITRIGTGSWLWGVRHPTTGERGLFILRGRFVQEITPEGESTFTYRGSSLNLCTELSP